MEKYEKCDTPPSPQYDTYTAEYIRTLFSLFHPVQSYRYPPDNMSTYYFPGWKSQVLHAEPDFQARQNAVRNYFNFRQGYAQSSSLYPIETMRNLPRYRRTSRGYNLAHKRRLQSRAPDYQELNRTRPSVIRRSMEGGSGKFSAPREAILQPSYASNREMNPDQSIIPFMPIYRQSETPVIHNDPRLPTKGPHIIQGGPQLSPKDQLIIHRDPQLSTEAQQIIQRGPQSEYSTFRGSLNDRTHFLPKYPNPEHLTSQNKAMQKIVVLEEPDAHFMRSRTTRIFYTDPKDGESDIPVDDASQSLPMDNDERLTRSNTGRNLNTGDMNTPSLSSNSESIQNTSSQKTHAQLDKKIPDKNSNPTSLCEEKTLPENANPVKSEQKNSENLQNGKKDKKFKFSCFYCKKKFRWFSHWQAHERIHTGIRPYKCTQCERCFTRGDGLQAHMVIHSTKQAHKCTSCSKVFSRKAMLDRHILEHTGIIPYKCDVCDVEVLDPERIEEHLSQHPGQKRFVCQYCKRCFLNGRRLVRHIRAHTGEKPFPCTQCKMRFSKKSALLIHHRVHSGVKPFRCPDCGKAFSISGNLRRHLLIHTGERPYSCTKCKKKFNNKSHLARHLSSQH